MHQLAFTRAHSYAGRDPSITVRALRSGTTVHAPGCHRLERQIHFVTVLLVWTSPPVGKD